MVHVFRDLKANLVAGDLVKDGYFGDEYQCFGFASWENNRVHYFLSPDENELYTAVEMKMSQGTITTPVMEILRHLKIADEQKEQVWQDLKEELRKKIMEIYSREYFAMLSYFAGLPDQNTAYPLLEQYRNSLPQLTAQKEQTFAGLVRMAKAAKILNAEHTEALLQGMEDTPLPSDINTCRTISGFAYWDNRAWQYYSNGYHSKTIAKKIQLTEKQTLTTPILKYSRAVNNNMTGTVSAIRNEFLSIMQETFDEDYWNILQKLHALPTPVNMEEFIKYKDSLSQLDPQALASITGYGFLWHVK